MISVVEASSSSTVCFPAPLVVPASQCSQPSLALRFVVYSSAAVPISNSFLSPIPSFNATAFPLPYLPHPLWPVSSLQHRPPMLQQASQPMFSNVSPSSLFFLVRHLVTLTQSPLAGLSHHIPSTSRRR